MRIWPVEWNPEADRSGVLEGADARHIGAVLRLKPGDEIRVSGESSKVFLAKITDVSKNRVSVSIVRQEADFGLKAPHVFLAVGISKPMVMEIAVQKAVELGCSGFFPLITQRSDEMGTQKIERLKRIAREACKQCGRGDVMEISNPVEISELPVEGFKIVLWEEEKGAALKDALNQSDSPQKIVLAVGPAGGFTAEEVEQMKSRGFLSAGLGSLILRTETAAISLVAVVNHHFDRV